jgi:DUF1707 SHOCT-like domain
LDFDPRLSRRAQLLRTPYRPSGSGVRSRVLYDLSSDLLVSDAERQRVEDDLRGHYEAGRLTLDEFQQRLDEAHAAGTQTQLDHVLRQLPAARLPSVSPRDRRWRSIAFQYALLNAIAVVIWLFGGANGGFWPKWVLLATLIMFARRVSGHRRQLPSPRAPK